MLEELLDDVLAEHAGLVHLAHVRRICSRANLRTVDWNSRSSSLSAVSGRAADLSSAAGTCL